MQNPTVPMQKFVPGVWTTFEDPSALKAALFRLGKEFSFFGKALELITRIYVHHEKGTVSAVKVTIVFEATCLFVDFGDEAITFKSNNKSDNALRYDDFEKLLESFIKSKDEKLPSHFEIDGNVTKLVDIVNDEDFDVLHFNHLELCNTQAYEEGGWNPDHELCLCDLCKYAKARFGEGDEDEEEGDEDDRNAKRQRTS